jgi:hypothetical protein
MAMSEAHKAALAEGRRQSRAIKRYLEALAQRRPGRPVTQQSLEAKLARAEARLAAETDPLKRVDLIQQRLDAKSALAKASDAADMDSLEADFVDAAKGYSERKRISYSAWREAGVSAAVLKKAGIARTRG